MKLKSCLEESLTSLLTNYLKKGPFSSHKKTRPIYFYANFPGGKFFRSHLFLSLCQDLQLFYQKRPLQETDFSTYHWHYCGFLEFHHTYTLIHDDLPSMDNDDVRRNRPSTHKAFSEWEAILAGDGLLSLSYECLAHCSLEPDLLIHLWKWALAYLGPTGLIEGQYQDLEAEKQATSLSLEEYFVIHELKTARLMQIACLGAYFSLPRCFHKISLLKDLILFGREIGLLFQLLDDLEDWVSKEKNIFSKFEEQAQKRIELCLNRKTIIEEKYQLFFVKNFLQNFLEKSYISLQIKGVSLSSCILLANPSVTPSSTSSSLA